MKLSPHLQGPSAPKEEARAWAGKGAALRPVCLSNTLANTALKHVTHYILTVVTSELPHGQGEGKMLQRVLGSKMEGRCPQTPGGIEHSTGWCFKSCRDGIGKGALTEALGRDQYYQ